MTLVEICVDDVAGARTAERCGADRVELCADLVEGGITPSIGMVSRVLEAVTRVAVHVLIRPRGGHFRYDADELAVMRADIEAITALPRDVPLGFVLSGLTPHGDIDAALVGRLVEACEGSSVTYSRAFDETRDRVDALEALVGLGVHRVLTGGGPGPADAATLGELMAQAGRRITILAAGGIRSHNVADLVAAAGVAEVHLRAPHDVDGRVSTSDEEVRAVLSAVGRTNSAGPAR